MASIFRDLPSDVYFGIDLLTTLGLTTKHTILIVQLAKSETEKGRGGSGRIRGARLRLRPIVITSLVFGFGLLLYVAVTPEASAGI